MMSLLLSSGVQLLLAILLDRWLGEFNRWHPLVGFGRLARRIENALYPLDGSEKTRFMAGAFTWLLAVVPITLVVYLLIQVPYLGWCLEVFLLYLVIGHNSLMTHANYVYQPLKNGDLAEAREKVGWLVSRETDQLEPPEIIRATIESILENGNDAVFGAVFWFLVAGAPGAVLYRLANTLDAMWGYKNDRFILFGRCAARMDDLLNLIPAQLCAWTYALFGNTKTALHCWLTQTRHYKSFNGGAVMSSGAGSLGIQLGGDSVYHGKVTKGIKLGQGRLPETEDIHRSVELVTKGLYLWAAVVLLLSIIWIS